MEHIHHRDVHVCHAHSGEHTTSVAPNPKRSLCSTTLREQQVNCIIFTTYHSLHRVVDSGIDINTIYFDEAHNGTAKVSSVASLLLLSMFSRYHFTATPKTGRGVSVARGMNNTDVWGGVLCNVPAQELIASGAIVPPKAYCSRPIAFALSTMHTMLMLTT